MYSTHLHSFVNYNPKVSSGFKSPEKPHASNEKIHNIDTNLTTDFEYVDSDYENDDNGKYVSNVECAYRTHIPSTNTTKERSAD